MKCDPPRDVLRRALQTSACFGSFKGGSLIGSVQLPVLEPSLHIMVYISLVTEGTYSFGSVEFQWDLPLMPAVHSSRSLDRWIRDKYERALYRDRDLAPPDGKTPAPGGPVAVCACLQRQCDALFARHVIVCATPRGIAHAATKLDVSLCSCPLCPLVCGVLLVAWTLSLITKSCSP